MDSLDYIDNYFKGQLNDDEIREFELRIEQDPVFAQDVAFYVSATGMLKQEAEMITQERFKELESQQPVKMRQSPVRKMVYWMAAAAVSIGLIFRMFLFTPTSTKMVDNYIANELTFETHVKMSIAQEDSFRLAEKLFLAKRFSDALLICDALARSYPEKDEFILNAGIIALKAGNIEKAITYFESYEQKKRYADQGRFYYAAALMKRNRAGDREKAKEMLEDIVESKENKHEIAAEWLKKM